MSKEAEKKIAAAAAQGLLASVDFSTCESVLAFMFGSNNIADWKEKILLVVGFEAVFLAMCGLDMAFGGAVHQYGIHPRNVAYLPSIFVAPFLNEGLSSVIFDSLPFVVLGSIVLMREKGFEVWWTLIAITTILGGLGIWCLGRDMVHEGSSSFIFAFFGYVLLYGGLTQDIRSVFVALVTFFFYGTTLLGMFSSAVDKNKLASWDSMIAGLCCGLLTAFLHVRYINTDDGLWGLFGYRRHGYQAVAQQDNDATRKAAEQDDFLDDEEDRPSRH